MFHKSYLTSLFTIAFLLVGGLAISAQTNPVRGVVMIKTESGKTPAVDINVEAYRADVSKGKAVVSKTNKRGEFQYVGLISGVEYALVFSGPGVSPYVYPKVKAGMVDISIEVLAGDGKTLTEEEARAAMANALPASNGELTEAQKKEIAEFEKKNAEITAKNAKIKDGDEIVKKSAAEGKAALDAQNWDLALTKYNEGIAAVPDFVGSTPVLMSGKITALRFRGYNLYKEGAGLKEASPKLAKYELAKKEFNDAIETYKAAKAIFANAAPATDPNDKKWRATMNQEILINIAEVYRLMTVSGVDSTRTAEAEPVFEEYITNEQDPAKKLKLRQTLGDVFRASGEFEKAIASYKLVIEAAPDNQEVMAMIGLCYFGLGTSVEPNNKEQLQEGLNYLDRYAQSAKPVESDSSSQKEFKQSVIDAVAYLKTEANLKAQKPAATPGRKKN